MFKYFLGPKCSKIFETLGPKGSTNFVRPKGSTICEPLGPKGSKKFEPSVVRTDGTDGKDGRHGLHSGKGGI